MAPRSSVTRAQVRHPVARLTPPFDGYPYLVTRIGHSALRHMAVLPSTWSRERLLDLTRQQASANRLDTCLALGPDDAVYVTADGEEAEGTHVPTGLPVVGRLRLAANLPKTPEMAARRERLRVYAAAQNAPGYIVGDGLEGGRPATSEDLIRLVGHEADDPHPGLARCPRCGEFGGDYLARKGEGNGDPRPRVIRIHCRCENHNRCARCGEPLAPRRLSAYHFVEETGSVCYVAAYCAFSHRCPASAGTCRPMPTDVALRNPRWARFAPRSGVVGESPSRHSFGPWLQDHDRRLGRTQRRVGLVGPMGRPEEADEPARRQTRSSLVLPGHVAWLFAHGPPRFTETHDPLAAAAGAGVRATPW